MGVRHNARQTNCALLHHLFKTQSKKRNTKQTNRKTRGQTGNRRIPARVKTTLLLPRNLSLKDTEDEGAPLQLLLVSALHGGIYSEHILNFTGGGRRRGQQGMRRLDGITDGHESEKAPEAGDGQGGLACCSPWGSQRVGHDWATELNWTECVSVNYPSTHRLKIQYQACALSFSKQLFYKSLYKVSCMIKGHTFLRLTFWEISYN